MPIPSLRAEEPNDAPSDDLPRVQEDEFGNDYIPSLRSQLPRSLRGLHGGLGT